MVVCPLIQILLIIDYFLPLHIHLDERFINILACRFEWNINMLDRSIGIVVLRLIKVIIEPSLVLIPYN